MEKELFKEFRYIKYGEDPEINWTYEDELNKAVILEQGVYSFSILKHATMKKNNLDYNKFEDQILGLDLTLNYLEKLFREKIIKIKIIQWQDLKLKEIDKGKYYFPVANKLGDIIKYKVKEYIFYGYGNDIIVNDFKKIIKEIWKYESSKQDFFLWFYEFGISFTLIENEFWS